jgi:phosphopantothenoylcysteine decarboxylase / phosphopantothenate---cysteine ligase
MTNKLTKTNIVIGITGGIAAYKICELVRLLIKQGASIRVIMTESAKQFVSPISLQVVSKNSVRTDLFDQEAENSMSHIELAKWADILLISPASANTIAKLSHGFADNLLSSVWLASNAIKIIAPAMNEVMWNASSTIENIKKLKNNKVTIIGPEKGEQACGDNGFGRMSDINKIVKKIIKEIDTNKIDTEINKKKLKLSSIKIMITAGPTIEDIDPVRYISNHSSGKMGYAIAQQAIDSGAEVILITGPTNLTKPDCIVYPIRSAQEMFETVKDKIENIDIFIACAAVADYRVDKIENKKIKKIDNKNELELKLVKNPDIVKYVSKLSQTKNKKLITVAFAAETNDIEKNATRKLISKSVDLIAANKVGTDKNGNQIGFNQDNNELLLLWKNGNKRIQYASKKEVANQLLEQINFIYKKGNLENENRKY